MSAIARVASYLSSDLTDESAQPEHQPMYGAYMAVDGFWSALLRHGAPGQYRVFHDRATAAHSSLNRRRTGNGIQLVVTDFARLLANFADYPFRVWHDVDGDLTTAATLRRRYATSRYPVTSTPHVLSYSGMTYDWALRMLVADIAPCDALICTSASARQATANLLDAVTESMREQHGIELDFGGRLDVIPLGVDTEALRPGGQQEARDQLGLRPESFVLLWLGRFSFGDKADLLPLLTVFRRLVDDNPNRDMVLILAGGGQARWGRTLRDYATRLGVGRQVRVVEPLPPAARHRYYAAADVFVSPVDNIQETFGITPIEAMACGVPQVVSDWNGYRDTVRHGETGLLVPTYWGRSCPTAELRQGLYDYGALPEHLLLAQTTVVDPEALRAHLQTLVDHDELRARMAQASRRRAVTDYSWKQVISAHEQLWNELSATARRLPPPVTLWRDHAATDYKTVFGHYPTWVLADTATVEITPFGTSVLTGELPIPAYLAALHVVDTDLLQAATQIASEAGPLELEKLTSLVCNQTGAYATTATDHVLWLLKQGMFRAISARG